MKGILKSVVIGLMLIGLNNELSFSAQDVVKTYNSNWAESQLFKNGASAFVTANDGGTTRGGSCVVNIIPSPGATFTFTLNDKGFPPDKCSNDGIYTGQIVKISHEPMNPFNLSLGDGQRVDIVVDLDKTGDSGTATIWADYTSPEIYDLAVSEEYFSPGFSYGKKDTTSISFKSNEDGRYEILIDNRVPWGTSKGTLTANSRVDFEWNGCDKYGSNFLEGSHTIQIKVWDEADNESQEKTDIVWIDNTPPVKTDIFLSDDAFSPGTSSGSQDITYILLKNDESTPLFYKLSIDRRILLATKFPSPGTGTGVISPESWADVVWGGLDENGILFVEGTYTIELRVEDLAGNEATRTAEVTIDNTPPTIEYLINNMDRQPVYRDQEVYFYLQASDKIAGTIPVEADGGIGGCTFNGKALDLVDCGEGIYVASYKVTQADVGTFAYRAWFEDKAGNPAINNGTICGTIILRGNQLPPTTKSRIVRMKVLTPEKATFSITSTSITPATSTLTIKSNEIKKGNKIKIKNNSHVWSVTADKDGTVILSNANIFYGLPISDYHHVGTITEGIWLKEKIKIDDEIIINLTAVNVLETLKQPIQTSIFEDSRIATGTMVVAYDTNGHIWLGTASQNGRFKISNANIYFGNLVENYENLGEITGVIANFAMGGVAYTDLGIIVQGISLYDDEFYTHRDVKAGDGIYSNAYTIKAKNDTTSYLYGYFKYGGENAENNGIRTQEEIVIDATPPNITNFGAFPSIFRPGSENVTIKYTLEEDAVVTIEIWDEKGNCIRKLTPPEPNYGDNCSSIWDGKNRGGVIVEDSSYYFKISAVDKAGNTAVERIGEIKASTVELKITHLIINPSNFTPTPQIKGDVDFWVNIHATMQATKKQLQNLGFAMDTKCIYTLPYLLVNITFFDSEGNELKLLSLPDLTGNVDTDPFSGGYPWYYDGPFGTETAWGRLPKLGSDLPDEGDGNKGNDWDILIALQREKGSENQYYSDWGIGITDWEIPNGTYLIRIQVKLVGSYWEFEGYVEHPMTKEKIGERWHQKPDDALGFSRSSELVVGRVEVIDSPVIKPDYIAPVVIATDPGDDSIHEPTENISKISAQLMDQGGAGLDLTQSTIILKNSIGLVVPGISANNGIDTVYWTLKTPLTKPDVYTIEVRPVDKAKNGLEAEPQKFTFTVLDRVGPEVSDILADSKVLKNGDIFGPNEITKIAVTLSEIEKGNSKVDFVSSQIIIKNEKTGKEDEPHNLFNGKRMEEITNENSGRIIYDNLKITEAGTYTIWVEAYDKAPIPNLTVSTKTTFYITLEGYIEVKFNYPTLGTKTYLTIPPDTKAYTITTTGVRVGSETIAIRQGTITKENENYIPLDPVIEFWWFNSEHVDIKLANPVPLTMYYGHIILPPGVLEDDLAIWQYNGTSWSKISGVENIDKNNDKITITLEPPVSLEDQYAIMYLEPKAVDVQYYHSQKGLVTCLKIPKFTTVNRFVVGTNTVTAGTFTTTRSGYEVVEPAIKFFLNGQSIDQMEFNNEVTLIMYYTQNDVRELFKRGLTENDLAIYEYDGTNWRSIKGILDQDKQQITYRTKIIRGQYAIMYIIPTIEEKAEVFEESVYAYPNPAKGKRVTFRYELVRDAKVTIKIYTLMGDLVWEKEYSPTSPQGKQGTHGTYPPGDDAIIWDCKNNGAKEIASGLYIYRITASDDVGEVTVTKKLIVIQ